MATTGRMPRMNSLAEPFNLLLPPLPRAAATTFALDDGGEARFFFEATGMWVRECGLLQEFSPARRPAQSGEATPPILVHLRVHDAYAMARIRVSQPSVPSRAAD